MIVKKCFVTDRTFLINYTVVKKHDVGWCKSGWSKLTLTFYKNIQKLAVDQFTVFMIFIAHRESQHNLWSWQLIFLRLFKLHGKIRGIFIESNLYCNCDHLKTLPSPFRMIMSHTLIINNQMSKNDLQPGHKVKYAYLLVRWSAVQTDTKVVNITEL